MPEIAVAAILVILVATAILLLRPRTTLLIMIEDGKAVLRRGKISGRFLRDCEEICARAEVRRGTIYARREGGRSRLLFSSGIPPACQQQLRNAWGLEAPRSRPG